MKNAHLADIVPAYKQTTFFFFFLVPSVAAGSKLLTKSRSQISIVGSIVPTATKLPAKQLKLIFQRKKLSAIIQQHRGYSVQVIQVIQCTSDTGDTVYK